MIGKEIYALGKNSPEAKSKVPLNFVHTSPRLTFDGNWHAEFWYFLQKFDGKTITISAPRLRLTFELPSKQLIKFESLEDTDKDSLNEAPELASKEFYIALNDYLNFCDSIIAEVPNSQILTKADELWKKTLPKSFRADLEELSSCLHVDTDTHPQADNTSETADSMLDQYQWEMSKAIASGNQAAYNNAKQKYDELKAR